MSGLDSLGVWTVLVTKSAKTVKRGGKKDLSEGKIEEGYQDYPKVNGNLASTLCMNPARWMAATNIVNSVGGTTTKAEFSRMLDNPRDWEHL
jgi:hypothetical protein